MGGLNLYSTASDTIDVEAAQIAHLFATQAAIALVWSRHEEQLDDAAHPQGHRGRPWASSCRCRIDDDRASSTSNITLRLIAQEVVETTDQHFSGPGGDNPNVDGVLSTACREPSVTTWAGIAEARKIGGHRVQPEQ
ncbi:MAG: hypothetical protein M3237_23710 [Actinomycetota bacterium]|nr:hypothetical protein [Actinomycetota bacterium]